MPIIKVILGSTRPERFGPKPAAWIMELAKQFPETTFELIDLADINLPMLDEPVPSIHHQYTKQHTKDWANIIGEADGFVIVTAEYNFGVPAALKNALDFLSYEWYYKPVAFVSYGASAGGARAVEHLRGSAGWLRMYDLSESVVIPNYWEQLDENGTFKPTGQQTENAKKLLERVAFWAENLKPIREKLLKQS
jgi:NAD(P)H-dependent FMN reductase